MCFAKLKRTAPQAMDFASDYSYDQNNFDHMRVEHYVKKEYSKSSFKK